jgi:hypothetical protein
VRCQIYQFESEKEALNAWRSKYQPLLYLNNGDDLFLPTLEKLASLASVPAEHIWINYHDGESAAFLANFKDIPLPESDTTLALYVTRFPSTETEMSLLLTDIDILCENCHGEVDDCPSCAGTGTIWVELDNPSGVSKDPSALSQFF